MVDFCALSWMYGVSGDGCDMLWIPIIQMSISDRFVLFRFVSFVCHH